MRKLVLPVALLLVAAGCKSKPELHVQRAPVKPLPAGWSEAASKDGVVSLGVPSGWRFGVDRIFAMGDLQGMGIGEGDQTNNAVQQMTQQLQSQGNEEEKKKLDELFAKGIVIHVINGSKPIADEGRTKFIVHRYDGDGNWDFDAAADKERGAYAHKPQRQDVQLPIGKAVKLSASEELRNGSVRHRISYLAIEGKSLYVLRFATEEGKDTIASIADAVAETWRIRPSK
ncbi:MAG: hypothetical protein ACO1SV_20260 [Fimbriimonas sp.]